MKKILIIIFTILLTASVYSQVAIGKETVSSSSASIEFGDEKRGILLPWVNSQASVTDAVDGTIIFDTNDKIIKYLKNGSWFSLSPQNSGAVDTNLQDDLTENLTSKVAIGDNAQNDTTSGILVLTDTDKAMVLPKVALPHYHIENPAPGMMVYDSQSKQLAVYNGTVWSFWMPEN